MTYINCINHTTYIQDADLRAQQVEYLEGELNDSKREVKHLTHCVEDLEEEMSRLKQLDPRGLKAELEGALNQVAVLKQAKQMNEEKIQKWVNNIHSHSLYISHLTLISLISLRLNSQLSLAKIELEKLKEVEQNEQGLQRDLGQTRENLSEIRQAKDLQTQEIERARKTLAQIQDEHSAAQLAAHKAQAQVDMMKNDIDEMKRQQEAMQARLASKQKEIQQKDELVSLLTMDNEKMHTTTAQREREARAAEEKALMNLEVSLERKEKVLTAKEQTLAGAQLIVKQQEEKLLALGVEREQLVTKERVLQEEVYTLHNTTTMLRKSLESKEDDLAELKLKCSSMAERAALMIETIERKDTQLAALHSQSGDPQVQELEAAFAKIETLTNSLKEKIRENLELKQQVDSGNGSGNKILRTRHLTIR
eukprot:GHVN01057586.1.p1 GENE.GHVN01057586.1~~GHVN01057586.1.p1  ORF type:complete len:423 (-),score=96.88 GHVN01057586.1:2924-4192(-)